jgi:hypothetical protein
MRLDEPRVIERERAMPDPKPSDVSDQSPGLAFRTTSVSPIRSPWIDLPSDRYVVGNATLPELPRAHVEPVHKHSHLAALELAIGFAFAAFGAAGGAMAMPTTGPTTSLVQTMQREAQTDAVVRATPAHEGDTRGIGFFDDLLHRAVDEAQHWAVEECCTTLGSALWWAMRHRKELPELTRRALDQLEAFLGSFDNTDVLQVQHDADAPAEEMHRRGCMAYGVMVIDRIRRLVHSLLCGDDSLASAEGDTLAKAIGERMSAHLPFAQDGTGLANTVIECVARSIAKQGLRRYCTVASPEQG